MNSAKKNMLRAMAFLGDRGSPPVSLAADATQVLVHRVWVRVTVDGTPYLLDPSFKQQQDIAGIDIAGAAGYSRTELLDTIGGTSTASSIKGLNEQALATQLTAYTGELLAHLKQTAPHATPREIIGGRQPIPHEIESLDNQFAHVIWGTVQTWDAIPTSYMATLRIQFALSDITLALPALQGQKLALTFQGDTAQLWLENTLIASDTVSEATVEMTLTVDHPFINELGEQTELGDQTETKTYRKQDTFAYAILYGYHPSGRLLRRRQQQLDVYMRDATAAYPHLLDANGTLKWQQLPDVTLRRQIVTEILNVMGLTWLYQTELGRRIIATQKHVLPLAHHRFGRMAQEEGYYVDVGLQTSSMLSRSGRFQDQMEVFNIASYFGSAMEHGVIEQLQGAQNPAVSTIKLVHLANQSAELDKDELFRVDASTFASVQPLLKGYSDALLTTLQNEVNNGAVLLLTEHAHNTLHQWTGTGYITSAPGSIGMIISGGYFGGFAGNPGFVDTSQVVQQNHSTPNYDTAGSSALPVLPTTSSFTRATLYAADPVDMASGAFVLQKADLAVGETAPRGLRFVRHYTSNRRHQDDAHLGYGWRHQYDIFLVERSAIQAGLGATTPADMTPYLVATMAALDVYAGSTTAKEWATACLIAKWGVDQLRNNAVAITLGTDAVQFIRLPDSTYQAPAGTPMTLTRDSDDTYVLRERFGNTLRFAPATGHRIETLTDLDGLTMTFTYDSADQLATVRDAYNRSLTLSYTTGRITAVRDSTGRTVTYTYDAEGNLTSATDPAQQTATFVYDSAHQIIELRDPQNRVITQNTYDADGRVVEQHSHGDPNQAWNLAYAGLRNTQEDPLGGLTTYFYDERARPIGIEDPEGHRVTMVYDGQDHLIARVTPKGESTTFVYDADDNLLRVVDPLGAETVYTYDASHRVRTIRRTDLGPSGAQARVTTYAYDSGNLTDRPNSIIDPRGLETRYAYHPDGTVQSVTAVQPSGSFTTRYTYTYHGGGGPLRTLRVTLPDGAFTETTYDLQGDITAERDPNGNITTYQYNPRRQMTRMTTPDGGVTITTYDAAGNLATVRNPRGHVTHYTYSPTKKMLSVTTGVGTSEAQTVTHTYDAREWRVATANALGETLTSTYDAAERLVRLTDPLGRETTYAYDPNGQRIASTSPLLATTTFAYNARGQRVARTDPDGYTITSPSNAFGELAYLTNRRNQTYAFTYDGNSNLLHSWTPRGTTTTQTWNDRNLLASVREPSGATTTFSYDTRGRLRSQHDALGTIQFTYDNNSHLVSVTEGTQRLARSFDALDRVTRYTDARGKQVQYAYDANGNLIQLMYPGGNTVTYSYDSHDRLQHITDWAGRVTTYMWDRAGRLSRVNRPNGTSRVLTYDRAGQLTRIDDRNADGVLLVFRQYAYDADGRLTSRFALPKPHPVPATTDARTYDADNRLATVNGTAVIHDTDGNLTSGPLTTDQFAPYTFDVRNRLTRVGGVSYGYDAEHNRTTMTTTAGGTHYVVDPHGGVLPRVLVREQPSGGQTFYVYGLGLLYEVDTTGNTTYYHADTVGSTVALTDAVGFVTDRMEYAPFGTLIYRRGTTDTPFLYAGHWGIQTDPNGLLYMRARYYNPGLRRFVSADPIGFAGGLNWYAYANNNPYRYVDPTGHGPQSSGIDEGTFITRTFQRVRNFLSLKGFRTNAQAADFDRRVRQAIAERGPAAIMDMARRGEFSTGVSQFVVETVASAGAGTAARGTVRGVQATLRLKNVLAPKNIIDDAAASAGRILGKDARVITNKAGDKVFLSKDGTKRLRFDIKNPHGDPKGPHAHIEVKTPNGKWMDATDKHRIYPKQN